MHVPGGRNMLVHLDFTAVRALGGPEAGEHLPKESRQDIAPVARPCIKSLRGQERLVGGRDARRRFLRRGGRARSHPP